MKIILLILVISSLLLACDCLYQLNGVVLDSQSLQPLEGVTVKKNWIKDHEFGNVMSTDSSGGFQVEGIAGFCDEFELHFSKQGYQPKAEVLLNNSYDTILLVRKPNILD
ncbi:MAG: hypothetical protein AAFO69_11450 [Bacteroidota bacterium]